jgi:hypothetical protein
MVLLVNHHIIGEDVIIGIESPFGVAGHSSQ